MRKLRITKEEIEKRIFDVVGNEYSILGDYVGSDKILVQHNCNECDNYKWDARISHIINGSRCPKCAGHTKTSEEFKKEISEKTNGEFSVIGEYINSRTKIKIKHNCDKCNNYIFEKTPNFLLDRNINCPKCSPRKKNTEIFKNDVYNLVGDEYIVIGEYSKNHTHIKMKHNCSECNYEEYFVSPHNFIKGRRCPKCNSSKGELKINKYLSDNKFNFITQYSFDNLLSDLGNKLRFDFAVAHNNKLKYLIEFDGKQHFELIKEWFTQEQFEKLQYHDRLKNEYCLKNNIKLIRISYKDFKNIEEILDSKLNE